MPPVDVPVRSQNWVSKTDLTRYLRCPYAFYLLDTGRIRFEDTVNQPQVQLIDEGVSFHAGVEAGIPYTIESADQLRRFAKQSVRLVCSQTFENADLEIYGRPDAIETAQGGLIPVEFKSHKDIQRSDLLELAFYWMLLQPHRTKAVSPRGYLVLRRNGIDEPVEVEIQNYHLEYVRRLLDEIRQARRCGVQPRICRCTVCSGVMRDEVLRITKEKKHLTLLWGVGPVSARCLEEIGIRTYDELLTVDSSTIVEQLRDHRRFVSLSQVNLWKNHASSYSTIQPVVFGDPLKLDGKFLALDLEYVAGETIWLLGLCLVGPGSREFQALWADTPAEEEDNLRRLAQITAASPLLPIITWNGNGADMPQLRNAAKRLRLGQALAAVESRHLDLYQHAIKAVRFPIPQLGLTEVASYFAIPKLSRIRNGLEALSVYQQYRNSRDEKRRFALKTGLLEYNRDDMEALVGVTEQIAALGSVDT